MASDVSLSNALLEWDRLPVSLLGSVFLILSLYSCGIALLFFLDRRRPRESPMSCEDTGAVRISAFQLAVVIALGMAGQVFLSASVGFSLAAFALAGALASAWLPLSPKVPSRRSELIFLVVAVSIAFVIRIWRLNEIFPQGVEQDEWVWAFNYFAILHQGKNPFSLGSFGIPVLPGAVNALLFSQLGITPFAIRFPSVVYGSLTVIPIYFLAKAAFNSRTGFAAAAILVFLPYHVFFSRILSGSRMVLGVCLSSVLLFYGFREDRSRFVGPMSFAFSGMIAALASYDYFAVRGYLVFIAVFWAVALLNSMSSLGQLAQRVCQFAYFSTGFLIVGLPLLFNLLAYPERALGRIKEESMIRFFFLPDWATISSQVEKTALMFNTHVSEGRVAWFSHPAVTYFDFFLAALFAVGFFSALFNLRRRWKLYGSLLLGLLCAVLPTLLSSAPPCSHRAVLSIIPVTLILAMMTGRLVSAFERCFRRTKTRRWVVLGASGIFVVLLGVQLFHRVAYIDSLAIFGRADHLRAARIQELLDDVGEVDRGIGNGTPVSLVMGPLIPIRTKTIHPAECIFELTAQSLYPKHEGLQSRIYAIGLVQPAMLEALDRIYPDHSSEGILAEIWGTEEYFRIVPESAMTTYRCSEKVGQCLTESGDFEAEVFLPLAPGEPPQSYSIRVVDAMNGRAIDPTRLKVDGQDSAVLTSGRFCRVALAAADPLVGSELVLEIKPREFDHREGQKIPLSHLFIPNRLPRWRMEATFESGYVSPSIDVPYVGMTDGLFLLSNLLAQGLRREHGNLSSVSWATRLQGGQEDGSFLTYLAAGGELVVTLDGVPTFELDAGAEEQAGYVPLPAGGNRLQIEFRGDLRRASISVILENKVPEPGEEISDQPR